ncbi:hypothetical protein DFH07DRAFT_240606 [Mycena maculata]|uniref:Uncharacterized protein n=1 Tax=Mycena maculata TaxID=230809 RepID=A0AAD7JT19_9AGAR|nr:hypothetical protein DFH07DRAFT_240606 [Mycena maculata]
MASTPGEDAQKRIRKCRKCQMPMKGHKAENCIAAQAMTLPATPPTTPQNIATSSRSRTRNNFEIGLERHWRDPSWTPQVTLLPPPHVPSDGPSLIPTVLVDEDGNTILGTHDAPASETSDEPESVHAEVHRSRPKTPMAQVMEQAHALSLCDPVLSIVKVSLADLPRMQATAGQSGLCTSIVRTPWAAPRFKDEFEPNLNWEDDKKMWVVVGDDPNLVQRTSDLQQQFERIPGAIKDDVVVVQATYRHIFLASIVSALVVLVGMSVLV